jgi:chaperonin GroES
MSAPENLIVVGDRVLIRPSEDMRTHSGLLLPQGVHGSDTVRSGRVIAMGPGVSLPSPNSDDFDEPWKQARPEQRYLPMQVEVGDFALFFKKAAVELRYEGIGYLVVPQAAILILVRGRDDDPSVA